tara:strand:- start:15285 stop:15794 length:510 start_codon:yes stop_codon:yes gene_type:complete
LSIIKQILIVFLLSPYSIVKAQEIERKIPKKAAIYSALIPGLGQSYNKKYWKIPIIYIGLVSSAYYIKESHESYNLYKNIYLDRISGDNSDQFQGQYSDIDLITLTNHHRRNREISILCYTGIYILNIIDASVSSHLFNYDISDNLSLNIQPIYSSEKEAACLLLSFNL